MAVDTAYVLQLKEEGFYQMCYFFTGNDSLKLTIEKITMDYNYHSDAVSGQNKILTSVFNNDTIDMLPSALSLQPLEETEDFHTVLNLHSTRKWELLMAL